MGTHNKKGFHPRSSEDIVALVEDKEEEEVCLCWGFTVQSTQWGHVERGQFT